MARAIAPCRLLASLSTRPRTLSAPCTRSFGRRHLQHGPRDRSESGFAFAFECVCKPFLHTRMMRRADHPICQHRWRAGPQLGAAASGEEGSRAPAARTRAVHPPDQWRRQARGGARGRAQRASRGAAGPAIVRAEPHAVRDTGAWRRDSPWAEGRVHPGGGRPGGSVQAGRREVRTHARQQNRCEVADSWRAVTASRM